MSTKDDALISEMLSIYGGKIWRTFSDGQRQVCHDKMRASLAVARKAILEEAAVIADRHRSKIAVNEPLWHDGADWACDRIAKALREASLSTQEQPQ